MSLKDIIPNTSPIAFPGLFGEWRFTGSAKALDIGNGVYWYGVFIALGLLIALWFCMKQAPRFGLTEDNVMDTVLWGMPLGIVGARLYYIVFYMELYRSADGSPDFAKMARIWDGGLAIYGGVIVGFLTVFIVSRVEKFSYLAMMDDVVMGVLIGQMIGRWGNFMNREAFGAVTAVPWRMRLWAYDGTAYDVHPTFLYESLWNLAGFLLIWLIVTKRRKFDGQNFLCYFLWYGLGRVWIEGLREDSLYLFDVTLFGAPVRVSQALSAVLAVVSAVLLTVGFWRAARRETGKFPASGGEG
ncbi:MAG: prolipoprotein diacylglyceryl transferase [Oscillospiraceae bacterium]|nr:prolipoprotein diacylglyceryl transferase [Oscillospiraceae bacterium]